MSKDTDWDKTISDLEEVREEGIKRHKSWLRMVDDIIEIAKKGKAKAEKEASK